MSCQPDTKYVEQGMNADDAGERHRGKVARTIAHLLEGQPRAERTAILTVATGILDTGDQEPLPLRDQGEQEFSGKDNPLIEALAAWHLILPRTRNCLINDGALGLGVDELRLSDVAAYSLESIVLIGGFGRICYYDLARIMKRYGWDFSARLPRQSAVPAHYFRDPESGLAAVDRELDAYRRSHAFDVHLLETKRCENLTYDQVAERCGVSTHAAKNRIRRAGWLENRRAEFPLADADMLLP